MIRANRAEVAEYGGLMTPYERSYADRELKEVLDKYRPLIVDHLVQEHNAAINNVKAAQIGLEKYKSNEVARWEAGRLASEMQSAKLLLEVAEKAPKGTDMFRGESKSRAEKITQLYNDAQRSNDMYKARAMGEILAGYVGDKELNSLAKQAERDLDKLHITQDIKTAEQIHETAWQTLSNKTKEVQDIAGEIRENLGMFATGKLSQQLKRVSFKEGKIYEPDDPALATVISKTIKIGE